MTALRVFVSVFSFAAFIVASVLPLYGGSASWPKRAIGLAGALIATPVMAAMTWGSSYVGSPKWEEGASFSAALAALWTITYLGGNFLRWKKLLGSE